jgi:hypothetical protein
VRASRLTAAQDTYLQYQRQPYDWAADAVLVISANGKLGVVLAKVEREDAPSYPPFAIKRIHLPEKQKWVI